MIMMRLPSIRVLHRMRELATLRLSTMPRLTNMSLIGMANISSSSAGLTLQRARAGAHNHFLHRPALHTVVQRLLYQPRSSDSGNVLQTLRGYANLTELNFSGLTSMSDRGLSFVAENAPNLISLNLKGCFRVTDDSAWA